MAMPSPVERIGKLEQSVAVLGERFDRLDQDVKRLDSSIREEARNLREVEKRLAMMFEDVARLQKKQDENFARRWDLWKLILAALFGSILAVAAGFAGRSLDRFLGNGSPPTGPPNTTPARK